MFFFLSRHVLSQLSLKNIFCESKKNKKREDYFQQFPRFLLICSPSKHFRNGSNSLICCCTISTHPSKGTLNHTQHLHAHKDPELIPLSNLKTRMNSVFAWKISEKYQSINPCNIPLRTVIFSWQGRKYFSYPWGYTEQIMETTGNWAVIYHRPYWCLFKLYFEVWGKGAEYPESSKGCVSSQANASSVTAGAYFNHWKFNYLTFWGHVLSSEAFLHLSIPMKYAFNFGIPYLNNFKGHSIYQSINLMKN